MLFLLSDVGIIA